MDNYASVHELNAPYTSLKDELNLMVSSMQLSWFCVLCLAILCVWLYYQYYMPTVKKITMSGG